MKRYFLRWTVCLQAVLLCGACADEMQHNAFGDATAEGLTLNLSVNNSRVNPETSALDASLREDVVNHVDVFFVKSDGTVKEYCHSEADGNGKFSLSGNGWSAASWQNFFTDASYEVYVIANKHDYDNPSTEDVEHDLSWVKNKTELLALTDTDPNVAKTQREKAVGNDDSAYDGKDFLMDGYAEWDAEADRESGKASISVNLAHAAAKISVNISYTEEFLIEGRTLHSVQKKLVRYAEDAKAVAEGGDIALVDLQGNSGSTSFSYADKTEGEGAGRKDTVYTYSYPNDWSEDVEERETYVLLNIPYIDNDTESLKNNYYKIPVRVSATTGHLMLERNMEYRVNVTVNRVGNTSPEEPVKLENSEVTVEPWRPQSVEISSNTPKYLELSKREFEMRNIDKDSVAFSSSSLLMSVTPYKVYFVNKEGNEKVIADEQIQDSLTVSFDKGKLNGYIYVNSKIPNNITIRYIELAVENNDGLKDTIKISQYPLEYIVGIPGIYSYRTDFTNNNYYNYLKQTRFENIIYQTSELDNSATPLYIDFITKVKMNSYIYRVIAQKEGDKKYLKYNGLSGTNNNRMYLVHITSVEDDVTISRPEMETDSKTGMIVPISSDENNDVVSPVFMLASQLGTVSTTKLNGWTVPSDPSEEDEAYLNAWYSAREHCSKYVEVVQYNDETYDSLQNWRLPSEAELQIIKNYQYTQPDVMDKVLTGGSYWSLKEKNQVSINGKKPQPKDQSFTRCIRDVTPAELKRFREKGLKI